MLKGFKNFLMRGDLIVIAVGLVVALAFSTLISAFTTNIITPLINAIAGQSANGSGIGWTVNGQRIALGTFISAIVYFIIFMAVVYLLLVVPYRSYMAKMGTPVFTAPAPRRRRRPAPSVSARTYPRPRRSVGTARAWSSRTEATAPSLDDAAIEGVTCYPS